MKFTIDYSKWRAGGNEVASIGDGWTSLFNYQGYMCCLGQVSLQLGKREDEIYGKVCPNEVHDFIGNILVTGTGFHTDLTIKAIKINDDSNLDTATRIKVLTNLFRDKGHELEFVNVSPGIVA